MPWKSAQNVDNDIVFGGFAVGNATNDTKKNIIYNIVV